MMFYLINLYLGNLPWKSKDQTLKKKKRKVTWSDNIYVTVDADTAYFAATQHDDIFATVDNAQIPKILSLPAWPDPVETTPTAAENILDTAEAETIPDAAEAQTTQVASTEAIQRLRTGQIHLSQVTYHPSHMPGGSWWCLA